MKELLEAGVHLGHQTRRWNPKMKPFIFGARNGIYIALSVYTVISIFAFFMTTAWHFWALAVAQPTLLAITDSVPSNQGPTRGVTTTTPGGRLTSTSRYLALASPPDSSPSFTFQAILCWRWTLYSWRLLSTQGSVSSPTSTSTQRNPTTHSGTNLTSSFEATAQHLGRTRRE